MAAARRCSECGSPLTGRSPRALTCSDKCRWDRKRRVDRQLAQERADNEAPDGVRQIREAVRGETHSLVDKVLKEELRPVVREAITEETIRAINSLVHLAPRAVELIAQDMEDDDPLVRQKAYTLMMKYTVGHPALVAHEDAAAGSQINVNFELPRPTAIAAADAEATEAEVVEPEDRTCDLCETTKPVTEFVANSSRCTECFDRWKETILQAHSS